jgi:hypothetical protein
MRKAIAGLAISGVMVMTMAAGASAGNAYGRLIKQQCGMSYGQLVSAVRSGRVEHAPITVRGAKYFVTSGQLDIHCPVVTQPET